MDVFTLLDNIEKCSKDSVIEAFNNSVHSLRRMLLSGTFALDSTIIETKPDFPGCGKTKRKKEGDEEDTSQYKYIHGFKLFILYEVKSRIIVAMNIVPANESDSNHLLSMVKQGIKNCGKGRIKVIVADRGFLDGAQMWEIKHKLGIDFIIPAKSKMIIREDAIALYNNYKDRSLAEWEYGKDKCQGYGVDGLTTYFEYNPKGVKSNKKTNGSALNAVVITTWRGRKIAKEKQKVILTSLPAEEDVAAIAKKYRLRSLIENQGFRELKQASYLKHLPRRSGEYAENAAYIHMMLCVYAHTLFYAFLSWRKKQGSVQSEIDCMRNWRKKKTNEKEKILIVAEEKYYAIYGINEIMDILGITQRYKI